MSGMVDNLKPVSVSNGWKADISLAYDGGMSVKSFIARLLANPMPASEALIRHVEGGGTGFEIDDLMSWSPTAEQEEKAIAPLLELSQRYASNEYPVGISNPASFAEVRALAESLRAQGL
jgi:hypothetical protein